MVFATRQSRSGMTLIELMVVIVILGVVSAMVVPSLGGSMATVQLGGAARDLASVMDFAYRSAIASGRVHALVINADRQRFEILAEQPPQGGDAPAADSDAPQVVAPAVIDDPTAAPELAPVAIPGFITRTLPAGIQLKQIAVVDKELSTTDDGDVRLLFFPDGTAEYAELVLSDEAGDQCSVTLDGLTGMIEVGEVGPAPKAQTDATAADGGA